MKTDTETAYFKTDTCRLDDFRSLVAQRVAQSDVPHADRMEKNIPIYDMTQLQTTLHDPAARRGLMAEWAHVLRSSAGVLVLKSAYPDTAPIDDASRIYNDIIDDQRARHGGGADHFAAGGTNDRIWNALQKLCEASPEVFARYFANVPIATVCEAWLGPNYQMTAQVNLVRPGGAAQQAHRDYHLGFQTDEVSARYPAHVHDLSPVLTLQGAVAHTDMPVESGPTKLLPFSQLYRPGYVCWRQSDFREFFEENQVQLPLCKGDAVFFNPALFHAAGANSSAGIQRMANLLQVSSAFGRAMESVDRKAMSSQLYPVLADMADSGRLSPDQVSAVIAASAEGYSFPTNLDRDPPVDGLAPETQAALLHRALAEAWDSARFDAALAAQEARRQP